jgi:hypothetical protein
VLSSRADLGTPDAFLPFVAFTRRNIMTVMTKLCAAGITLFALSATPALASDVTEDRAAAIASLQRSHEHASQAPAVAGSGTHHRMDCGDCCARR